MHVRMAKTFPIWCFLIVALIIIIIIIIIITYLLTFHASIFNGVWVAANLESPGLFSTFWPILVMM